MQKIIVMIGQPSVGKSTTVEQMGGVQGNYIISRDEIVMSVAEENGLSYTELFIKPKEETLAGSYEEGREKYGKVVEIYDQETGGFLGNSFENIDILTGPEGVVQRRMKETTFNALNQDKNIIVDMTMLTIKDRTSILESITKEKDISNISIEAKVFETKTLKMFQDLDDGKLKEERIGKIKQEFLKGNYGPYKEHIEVMENRTKLLKANGQDPKRIPNMVLVLMAAKYEEPTHEEGFHNIEYIQVDHSKFKIKDIEKEKRVEKVASAKNKKINIQEIK